MTPEIDELERLRARVAELEAALKPFSDEAQYWAGYLHTNMTRDAAMFRVGQQSILDMLRDPDKAIRMATCIDPLCERCIACLTTHGFHKIADAIQKRIEASDG